MLKHEFEQLTTGGDPISADLFEEINRDYMATSETKAQYVCRVFGRNPVKTPKDVEWLFLHYQKQQRETASPKISADVLKIQRLVVGARKDLDAKNAAAVFHAFNMIMAAAERIGREVAA